MKDLLGGFCKKVKEIVGLNDKEENKLLIRGLIVVVLVTIAMILVDYILKSIPTEVYIIFGIMMLGLVFRFAERLSQTPWPDDSNKEQGVDLTGTPGWHMVLDKIIRPVYMRLIHRSFIADEVIYMGPKKMVGYYYARIDDHKVDDSTICRMLERKLSEVTGIPLKDIVNNRYVIVSYEYVIILYDLMQQK